MKIAELPKQSVSEPQVVPEEFQFVQEKEIPALRGDIIPEDLDEGEFDDEIVEGLDVVCYTRSKAHRPWIGRVTEVRPGQKFVINWYSRKRGSANTFHAMVKNAQPYCSTQENACVILWGFSEQRTNNTFFVSNYWLLKIKSEYSVYDKNEL